MSNREKSGISPEKSGQNLPDFFLPLSPGPEVRNRTSPRENAGDIRMASRAKKPEQSLPHQYAAVMKDLAEWRSKLDAAEAKASEFDDEIAAASGHILAALNEASRPRTAGQKAAILKLYDLRTVISHKSGPSKRAMREAKAVVRELEKHAKQISKEME